jgi:hypothetical protein
MRTRVTAAVLAACALAVVPFAAALARQGSTAAPATSELTSLLQQRRELLRRQEQNIKNRREIGTMSGADAARQIIELRYAALKFETDPARRIALRQEIVEEATQVVRATEEGRRAGMDDSAAALDRANLVLLDARIELEQEKRAAGKAALAKP